MNKIYQKKSFEKYVQIFCLHGDGNRRRVRIGAVNQ